MSKRIHLRLFAVLSLTLLSIYLFAGLPPTTANMKQRIRLGLDLKGGVHLVLQVVTDDAVRAETDRVVEAAQSMLQKENIAYRLLTRKDNNSFIVNAADPSKETQLTEAIGRTFQDWDPAASATFTMKPGREKTLREESVEQEIKVIRNRIDRLGVAEPVIQKYGGPGSYQLLVQLPGVDDLNRVKAIIQATALLELKLVDSGPFANEIAARNSHNDVLPDDLEILPWKDRGSTGDSYFVVRRVASITGRELRSAYVSRDAAGRPAVAFTLTAGGSQRFANLTGQNVGKDLAIVLDGKIQSVAGIKMRISDSGIIEGGPNGYSPQAARDLATILQSGALPASLKYMEEEKVSAILGADSIRAGVQAAGIALMSVVVFMLWYYRAAGINAMLAMILNILILLGAMAYFGITLTLPGIAGVTLTIGVGIDSNVLIFERVREELRAGKTAVASVATGFSRVFVTLVDTHLAALISAVFLFLFGTGPVRGFAVTLVIGLLSNMFTAVFVSRTLFEYMLGRQKTGATISI
jgi:preprotein translocase subunit SecD